MQQRDNERPTCRRRCLWKTFWQPDVVNDLNSVPRVKVKLWTDQRSRSLDLIAGSILLLLESFGSWRLHKYGFEVVPWSYRWSPGGLQEAEGSKSYGFELEPWSYCWNPGGFQVAGGSRSYGFWVELWSWSITDWATQNGSLWTPSCAGRSSSN